MIFDETPRRPALKFYGGKWNLAPWIVDHFPEHLGYVDLCGGAGSILLHKPRSKIETFNDLDGLIVNFFRVLRDHTKELIRRINLTPWARDEFEKSRSAELCPDPIERARLFYIRCTMSIAGSPNGNSGFKTIPNPQKAANSPLSHLDPTRNDLLSVAQRFLGVQFENKPWQNVIERFDNPVTLAYLDPPYVKITRSTPNQYNHEWSDADHEQAAWRMRRFSGLAVVSGYNCDLYRALYESHGWVRFDKETTNTSNRHVLDSIWLSPRTYKAWLLERRADLQLTLL